MPVLSPLLPEHLLRRSRHIVQNRPLPSVCWADIPQLSAQDGRCPSSGQPPRDPRLLQEGHLFGRKEVAIPISAVTQVDNNAVEQVDNNGVRLNLTKQQVQDLPPVDTDHPRG